MHLSRLMYQSLSLIAVMSMLFAPVSPLIYQVSARTPVGQTLPQTTDPLLYRTTITLRHATDLVRLAEWEILVLEETELDGQQTATVLVDTNQLENLARLRFNPRGTESLNSLLTHNVAPDSWLARDLQPLLTQAATIQTQLSKGEGDAEITLKPLRNAVNDLSLGQKMAVNNLISPDDDADGLTNTQEAWWCTDPLNADSDSDGANDGDEVAALKAWLNNETGGPPIASGKPFLGWPPDQSDCYDDDLDSVPDLAEVWELGLLHNRESTDRDKFDDGQELFGNTYCPGSGGFCGYGVLPRDADWGVILAEMPAWVNAPGNHPLVAAFPVPEVDVVESSLNVELVTIVTTEQGEMSQNTQSYSTAKTEGTSTSVADTVTWNEWEEVSETIPLAKGEITNSKYFDETSVSYQSNYTYLQMQPPAPKTSKLVQAGNAADAAYSLLSFPLKTAQLGKEYGNAINGVLYQAARYHYALKAGDQLKWPAEYWEEYEQNQAQSNLQRCPTTCAGTANGMVPMSGTDGMNMQYYDTGNQQYSNGIGGQILTNSPYETTVDRYYPMSYPMPLQVPERTETHGNSWGGSQTNTTTQYEEHTVTNGEAFTTGEDWRTAVATDTAHTADLWFTYQISNRGDEYAREIADLAFNVYIGDDPNPAITYFVAPDVGGDGKFHNFMPGESHQYTSARIPLSLEQMKAIDLGGPLRVVVEDYTYGIDELFYQDAANASVLLAIEDGLEDGDEAIDTYLVPTWGQETVLDVMARYFPHDVDAEGDLIAVWTPEPGVGGSPSWCAEPRQVGGILWCQHAISTADWWNIYTNDLGDGSEALHQTPAVAGGTALFRFNKDSDLDGYSNRSEIRLGTDENDPADHPQPELLTGLAQIESGDHVTATLAFLNTGSYDAYGVEAVMYAPDDSVTVTNNTVGGSGRVKAGRHVVVGSRILPASYNASTWGGTAQPYSAGFYLGQEDRIYTFTAQQNGTIGAGSLNFNWTDGLGDSGSINAGSGYLSPSPIPVAHGLQVGFLSGSVQASDVFTVAARTPRDTFQYTINQYPYTPPVVVVSYNDPQGNHRFITPITLTSLISDLTPYSGQMLPDPGVEIVTEMPISSTGTHTTTLVVNNPAPSTLVEAHLFLEFVNITGTVAAEFPYTVTLPAGPSVVPVSWDTSVFSPTFKLDEDYIVMAFFTDWEGNIIDTAARPLSSFQDDPRPVADVIPAQMTWNFGTATQGEVLRHSLHLANTGFLDLLAYAAGPPEISLTPLGSHRVYPADMTEYELTLNTAGLPAGPYSATVTLRTGDPKAPLYLVQVTGTIDDSAPSARNSLERPLDLAVTIPGNHSQGEWISFTHTLAPDAPSLHPVKVYDQDYGALLGVGKYASNFGEGTASADMFGTGRDGDLVVGAGQTVYADDVRATVTAHTEPHEPIPVDTVNGFAVGDEILVIRMRGAFPGKNDFYTITDINTIDKTLTVDRDHWTLYVDSTSKAQVVKVPHFRNVTIEGTLTSHGWNGYTGGIVVFRANASVEIQGSIDIEGKGFRGGNRGWDYGKNQRGQQGESVIGMGSQNISANGSGGGGGGVSTNSAGGGGGGGGYASPGLVGHEDTNGGQPGYGGGVIGSEHLVDIYLGSGGGGGGVGDAQPVSYAGDGGDGGGILVFSSPFLSVTGTINADGEDGETAWPDNAGGGGGSGGSIKILGQNIELVDGGVTAFRGLHGPGNISPGGGNGGVGRIRIEYCDTLTGTTNPAASTQKLDCYIIEQIETTPYNTAQLNLPEVITNGQTYQVQYGRKLDFASGGELTTSLRISNRAYLSALMDALVSNTVSDTLVFKVDIGDDGSWDWQSSQSITGPLTLNSPALAGAFNSAIGGPGAEVDVPVRVSLNQAGQVILTNLVMEAASADISLTSGDISFGNPAPTEGEAVPVTITLHNNNDNNSGPLTVAAYANAPGWGDWYIGSAFVPAVPGGGTTQAVINWATLGFTGTTSLRVVADPYNRLAETNEGNNEASADLGILTRPDLHFSALSLSDDEPVVGEAISVTLSLNNNGQTSAGPQTVSLYNDNPADNGLEIASDSRPALPGGLDDTIVFTWVPTTPGPYRLFALADSEDDINEFDEGNNQRWHDVYVGFAGPLLLDSGDGVEPVYTDTLGYGYLDPESDDQPGVCDDGNLPEETLRRDPGGVIRYKFDHLLPGHFYHLDITMYECDGAGRQETIYVDGYPVSGSQDLGDGEVHRLSIRLDPALYADRVISVTIEAEGIDGAVVNAVNLHDIDYRYADAGGANDPIYPLISPLPYGWLDGVANSSWGGLPYQSVRVDQNDNELNYRFDGLDPLKNYNIHTTMWQPSGSGRTLQIRIDGQDVGTRVDTGDYQIHRETVDVPWAAYASDGSVIVSVLRTNAQSGAMVNEIALEEETLSIQGQCVVPVTPYFSEVYGAVNISGQSTPPGTVVQAFNPRGDMVGCFIVDSAGQYGFMRLYGEDAQANPPISGMRAGEIVTFRVNGAMAVADPVFYWQNDHNAHQVDLNAGTITGQTILMQPGWNLFSFQLMPPVPSVAQVLANLEGRYDLVLGDGVAYSPDIPPQFNTLKELEPGKGYYIRLTNPTSIISLIEGTTVPVTTPIAIKQGWNWLGYLPQVTWPISQALQSIDGHYQKVLSLDKTYYPDQPEYNTLSHLKPGQGYLLYATSAVSLTYPAGSPSFAQAQVPQYLSSCGKLNPTPYFNLVYGDLSLNGQPAPLGTQVEILTPDGEVAGCGVVTKPGRLGFTHVYGQDEAAVPPIPGFQAGQSLTFRINGFQLPLNEALVWQNDWTPLKAELSLTLNRLHLPLILKTY